MSGEVEMLCLANSIKHEQRCLAGVRLDTGGWIRPVSSWEGGALFEDQYTTKCGTIVEPLDSVRVCFEEYVPLYHQPENWLVAEDGSWELLSSELDTRQQLVLNIALQREGKIFSTERNSRSKVDLKDSLSTRSLTLIRPQNPQFYVKSGETGSDQPRVEFDFDGYQYDFPITDPAWRRQTQKDGVETLPSVDELDNDQDVLFTISLGEAYEGRCYKIVAAIFSLDSKLLVDI